MDRVREKTSHIRQKPVLAVILVGNDPVSAKYVSRKAQAAEYVGIDCFVHRYPEHITTKQLIEEVKRLQLSCDGLIVQLPLPHHVYAQEVLDAIQVNKDVDCLSSEAIGKVSKGISKINPPTAAAIMEILAQKKIQLKGKRVVVVGQGQLVGKPVALMMMNQPVTLIVCGEATKKLADETKTADILITGVGKAKLITAAMIKKGAVVIDVGTTMVKGKIVGDVDYDGVVKKAKYITPAIGGVGPVTVAKLFENVVDLIAD